ncbi:MAG: cysteine dioxygenase family protein [Gammaproteobacteria bacterium]|nr:cysteine dioxygenase family protein [Gammaproteobacteria bacterium]
MQTMPFKGDEALIKMIDQAVTKDSSEAITAAIKQGLCELVGKREVKLPECCLAPVDGHYARRLLYRSEEHGYSVVAMTWGPEQGTPIHDHGGLWCVEAVCCGRIKVVQYELEKEEGSLCYFENQGEQLAEVGTAGCLIPPHEYHTIHNACGTDTAVTLHIYADELDCCCTFTPTDKPGWYERERKDLGYDAA